MVRLLIAAMLLACLILTLFTVGIVVPCVIDVATSPPWAIRTLSRRAWLVITILGSLPGCVAWLLAGRPHRIPLRPRRPRIGRQTHIPQMNPIQRRFAHAENQRTPLL